MSQTTTPIAVVLVVEDQPIQRMMAVDVVERAGFEAIEAADAAEAIAILESRLDIQIVFTDIDMPGGVDGMKLALKIRDRWPPIELIFTSGKRNLSLDDMPERGVFLPKPYRRDELGATMRRLLQRS